ncbi:hypothetical protein NESM_000470000 [Novymonas esmeraldas]|uniref:Uncharacterized protein n=1 Tax=Novymonas esmeraldas TaxID=1808958 RepID=A0AAW0EMZ3_9TRYP
MSPRERQGGCRLRVAASPRAVVLVVLVCLVVFGAPVAADLTATPLCAEQHGFAGEFNDHFSIPVEKAPGDGEAIVLIARAFPLNFGYLLSQWLYINATYHIPEGAQVTRISDNNGILELPSVAPGTDVEVRVIRVRADGPVPFRFFSFVANNPVCHIAVAPDNSFLAPVPHKLSAAPQPRVTMYFKTVLPATVNALTVRVSVDGRAGLQFNSTGPDGKERAHTSGDLVQAGSGSAVLFTFTPPTEDMPNPYCFTTVSVTYGSWQGGNATPPSPSTPSAGGGSGGSGTPAPTSPSQSTVAPASQSMSVLRQLLWILLLLFVAYQVAVSVYNYRVLGKRDVMEIVPCAESVVAGTRTLQLAASRQCGVVLRRKDGYDSLQNPDDPYA